MLNRPTFGGHITKVMSFFFMQSILSIVEIVAVRVAGVNLELSVFCNL